MQFNELQALFGVQNASLDMLRELYVELGEASYWLKLESCPAEEDKQPGQRSMDGSVNVFPQLGEKCSHLWVCWRGSVGCGKKYTKTTKIKGVRDTDVASIAEAFGCGWTIGECLLDPPLTSCRSVFTATVLVLKVYQSMKP